MQLKPRYLTLIPTRVKDAYTTSFFGIIREGATNLLKGFSEKEVNPMMEKKKRMSLGK